MNKIKLSTIALTLLSTLALPAPVFAQNAIEQIALTILAQKFGLQQQQAEIFQVQNNITVIEAAPVYSMSYHTHRPVNEVWVLRRQGLGWGQVAQRLGMNPGTFNRLRRAGAFDRDAIWISTVKSQYGYRDSDLVVIRQRGASMRDLLLASIIGRDSRTSPTVVYLRYVKDRDWNRTARVYKVDMRDHPKHVRQSSANDRRQPVRVIVRRGNDKDKDKDHGKGKRIDQRRGDGKAQGKGEANGHGKGKSQGKSKGKGHGKGDR